IHNITVSGKIPVLTGASVSGDRLLVVGYVPGGGKAPDRGLVRLGPSQWIMVSPERADRSLRVHAVETSNGRPRLVVEIVGRETQILEMRGEEPGPSVSLSTLAPYILRGVRSGPGYFVITGELFLHENGETVRAKTAYIISSIARFSLARSPTDAVLITRSGSAISTSRLTNASETVTPIQDSLPVRSYTLDRTDEPLSNANGSAKVYGVYVDRAILLCALAAVTSAYTIPVVAAVASYNNVNGGGRRA
ncbi:MAG: hypothetical protein F7C34_02970, partial [Desulfurococcales archaeon]|nr:hypothetical protein [Desulfurococcales archaeon]